MAYIVKKRLDATGTTLSLDNVLKLNGIRLYGDMVEDQVVTGTQIISVSDGTNTETYEIELGTIELCKIINNQDYIYKLENIWYKHQEIGFDDEYYVLDTPIEVEINDTTLINELNAVALFNGTNNISITSENLVANLYVDYDAKNMDYYNVIYSGNSQNKVKIFFGGVELEDADRYCEKITLTKRILPNDGLKRFSLDNFVSQEVELILHRIDTSIIKDKVEIQIGTLTDSNSLGDTYEYVPLGIFNIQDEPTTDKDKITIKLRDNAVLFDFGYNAKPLIDNNGGKATKMQILQDICNQANVICNVSSFDGMSDELATYDNTITGRIYVSYLAEQSGNIATINRDGELIFIDISQLNVQQIPLSIVEKYEIGDKYKIQRVVYEDAIRKFETSSDETLDTLFINSANPYISFQTQIENIGSKVINFEIDSLKTGKILGNPTIDAYDIIEIYGYYDENKRFVDDKTRIVARTLANHKLVYNGGLISEYDTQIGKEERTENVTLKGEPTFQKYAKTSIDNINNNIEFIVAEQNETNQRLTQVVQDVNSIQNLFQITGGNNMIKDSQLLLKDEGMWNYGDISTESLFPSDDLHPLSNKYPLEYYYNEPSYIGGYDATLIGKTIAIAKIGISNGKMETTNTNITGLLVNEMYTLSFKISNDANTTSKVKLVGNGNVVYSETFSGNINMREINFSFVTQTSNYILTIQSSSTTDGYVYVYDLMLNKGDVQTWTPASGELVSTTIKLSQLGVQVYSTGSEIATLMTSEGFQIRRFQNNTLYEIVTEFTKDGFKSKKGILDELQLGNYDFKTIQYDGYETLILYKKESD